VAHGVAALVISRPYLPFGDPEAFADRIMRSAWCGYVASVLIGPDVPPQETLERLKVLR
jgi:hypothetical protein